MIFREIMDICLKIHNFKEKLEQNAKLVSYCIIQINFYPLKYIYVIQTLGEPHPKN